MAINTDLWLVTVQRIRDCGVIRPKWNTHVIARNVSDNLLCSVACNVSAYAKCHNFRVMAVTKKDRDHYGYPQIDILVKDIHRAWSLLSQAEEFISIRNSLNLMESPSQKIVLLMTIWLTARKDSIISFHFKTSHWETGEKESMEASLQLLELKHLYPNANGELTRSEGISEPLTDRTCKEPSYSPDPVLIKPSPLYSSVLFMPRGYRIPHYLQGRVRLLNALFQNHICGQICWHCQGVPRSALPVSCKACGAAFSHITQAGKESYWIKMKVLAILS